jgi:hypothetical protein
VRFRQTGVVRRCLLLALAAALVAVTPGAAADQARIKSYCSPSGDVCYGVFQVSGQYRFKLTLAAKYFARYRICVVPLGQTKTCKSFPVKKTGAQWGGTVIWQRNFPIRGPRRYKVSWLQGTHRLGPVLAFNLPAP